MHRAISALPPVVVALLALTSCTDTTTPPTPFTEATVATSTSTVNKPPCSLTPKRTLVEWHRFIHPPYEDGSTGLPPDANEIGDVDMVNCKPTLADWHKLHESSQADGVAGYRDCYQIAWADDNPGYNVNASPAPRLKNILDEAGNDCP